MIFLCQNDILCQNDAFVFQRLFDTKMQLCAKKTFSVKNDSAETVLTKTSSFSIEKRNKDMNRKSMRVNIIPI